VGLEAGVDNVEKKNSSPYEDSEVRALDRLARSQSLYRLRYSGSCINLPNLQQRFSEHEGSSPKIKNDFAKRKLPKFHIAYDNSTKLFSQSEFLVS
jgi:hypothetical protein